MSENVEAPMIDNAKPVTFTADQIEEASAKLRETRKQRCELAIRDALAKDKCGLVSRTITENGQHRQTSIEVVPL